MAGPVFYGQWVTHFFRGELDSALRVADDVLLLSKEKSSQALDAAATYYRLSVLICQGDFAEAHASCLRALALDEPSHHGSYDVQVQLARTLAYLGYPSQAKRALDAGLVEARNSGSAETLARALSNGFFGGWMFDTVPALLSRAEEVLAIAETHGFRQYLAAARAGCAWGLITLGRVQEGLPLIEISSDYRATGSSLFEPFRLMIFADAYCKLRNVPAGLECTTAAMALIDVTNERWLESELLRIRGTLLAASGDRQAAEASMVQALGVARRQNARGWELRSALTLARLWRDQGRSIDACNLLRPVVNWFTEGFETPDLRAACDFVVQGDHVEGV